MSKTTGEYRGDPTKVRFPAHHQDHDTACGLACLRMLEEWATGSARSERAWRKIRQWDPSWGVKPERMRKAVRENIPGTFEVSLVDRAKIDSWRTAPATLPDISPGSVYLLLTDCYLTNGRNVKHWIIVADLFWAVRRRRPLAWVADPLRRDDTLEVRPWDALLATQVLLGLHLLRLSPPPPCPRSPCAISNCP